LLPLTTGSSLAIQFSSYGDLPAVIHIGRIVPKAVTGEFSPQRSLHDAPNRKLPLAQGVT